jgi:hypothetical protein
MAASFTVDAILFDMDGTAAKIRDMPVQTS